MTKEEVEAKLFELFNVECAYVVGGLASDVDGALCDVGLEHISTPISAMLRMLSEANSSESVEARQQCIDKAMEHYALAMEAHIHLEGSS